MRDVFQGWRRKTGVVALAMACLLVLGWIRSHFYADWLMLPLTHGTTLTIRSFHKDISLQYMWETENSTSVSGEKNPETHVKWESRRVYQRVDSEHHFIPIIATNSVDRTLGTGYHQKGIVQSAWISHLTFVLVPIPLSAYLLLGKTRKPTSGPTQS